MENSVTLSDLGNLGEFVGALGVVLSLVYLAIQIRQNTRSTVASTEMDARRAWSDWDALFARDRDLTELVQRGLSDFGKLDGPDVGRFNSILLSLLRIGEMLHRQHERGLIDTELWQAWQVSIDRHLAPPGAKAWLSALRPLDLFGRSFREHIESRLAAFEAPARPKVPGD